jgi:hypothetical protein
VMRTVNSLGPTEKDPREIMKSLPFLKLVFALVLAILFSVAVNAQPRKSKAAVTPSPTPSPTPAKPEITSDPPQLTIVSTFGETPERRVVLSASGAVVALAHVRTDLGRIDERTVLAGNKIKVNLTANQIAENKSLEMPVTFDLTEAPSGEFKGGIRLEFEGGKFSLPVVVKVKDRWQWPLVILILGVVISYVITRYRESGKPRDEVLSKAGRLLAAVNEESQLNEHFRARIKALLVDVQSALDEGKLEDAQKAIKAATEVFNRWVKGSADWLSLYAYRDELLEKIKQRSGDDSYVRTVRRGLEEAGQQAPDLAAPKDFRDKLDARFNELNDYNKLSEGVKKLFVLVERLQPPQEQRRERAVNLRRRLEKLLPSETAARQALLDELATEIEEVQKLPQTVPDARMAKGIVGDFITLNLSGPAPEAGDLLVEAGKKADWRLKLLKAVSFVLALVFLTGLGFHQLYLSNPTFGASRWLDYFSLLLWGFGAEASRSSIEGMLKGWSAKTP